ncbi:XkdQ/YqbQ family protein [Clostridium botulinum]|uniref:XkdQ/YqbQ family protein n=1 Tax=Clostridium botulinum TaxID=1491 RepID=UPI0004D36014|nr:hypothetical protein [Clostridium botulinum]KEH90625.1 XkdQ [Clostridium botulinum C/D str. It1]
MATIILNDKYKIQELNEGITLNEAIDGIAYTANINLVETPKLAEIRVRKGMPIEIWDTNFETKQLIRLFKGIVWDFNKSGNIAKHISTVCKERTIYLEQSEDEYIFPEMSADMRMYKYCRDWGIPYAHLPDTKIKLSKATYKSTIFDMIKKDLKETAQKGGDLYNIRMLDKLNILKLGSNKIIWKLETIAEDIQEHSSLEGAITKVKVLGQEKEGSKTPVIGTYIDSTNRYNYGTLQKIVEDEKVKNGAEAKKRADLLFNTGKDTFTVSGIDINTIRTGDKVSLNGQLLYVIDVTHELGYPGKMNLNLGTLDYIRREFYSDDF